MAEEVTPARQSVASFVTILHCPPPSYLPPTLGYKDIKRENTTTVIQTQVPLVFVLPFDLSPSCHGVLQLQWSYMGIG